MESYEQIWKGWRKKMEDENYGMLMFNTRATYISTRAETGLELRFQGNTLNNN